MRRYIQWFAVVGWLLTMFPVALAAESAKIQAQMMDPVVMIDRHCSGIVIESAPKEGTYKPIITRVLTAKHCLVRDKVVTFDIFDEETGALVTTISQQYDVVRTSSEDLALIQLRDTKTIYPTAKLANSIKVGIGDTVYVVGFPFALEKVLTTGEYQRLVRDPIDNVRQYNSKKPKMYILASTPVAGGNSGGAMFQKVGDEYQVIGVTSLSAQRAGYPHLSFWVGLPSIQKFLSIEPKEEPTPAELIKKALDQLECEDKAGDDEEARAKCSEPEGEATP